jgi:polysaccharide pyruvyl transferase WcaK-like protein
LGIVSNWFEWPLGRPRILVTDAWLANAGDAAIAGALDDMLRGIAPQASIVHAAYHGDLLGRHLPGLSFVPPLDALLGTRWTSPAPGWEQAGRELVDGADVVISQGGGFLVEEYQPWTRIAALATVARSGLPLALVGQSVGRFGPASIGWDDLRAVFEAASLVVVRDRASLDHVEELGACGVVLGTDLSLQLFRRASNDEPEARLYPVRHGIGVVLSKHHPAADQRVMLAATAIRLLRLVVDSAGDEPITLWSTTQGLADQAGEDDARIAASAIAALDRSSRARVELVSGYVPPYRAMELVASHRSLVSMRLHPALFAAGSRTPFALVFGGQRSTVLADTGLQSCCADPVDRPTIDRVVRSALDPRADDRSAHERLQPLWTRLAETRVHLAEFLLKSGVAQG